MAFASAVGLFFINISQLVDGKAHDSLCVLFGCVRFTWAALDSHSKERVGCISCQASKGHHIPDHAWECGIKAGGELRFHNDGFTFSSIVRELYDDAAQLAGDKAGLAVGLSSFNRVSCLYVSPISVFFGGNDLPGLRDLSDSMQFKPITLS